MIPDEILDTQACLCQAMGHKNRLTIVHSLYAGERNVSELMGLIGCSHGSVSRQLGVLRQAGVVIARWRGADMYYQIADPKIMTVCDLMREGLIEQINQHSKILNITDAPGSA